MKNIHPAKPEQYKLRRDRIVAHCQPKNDIMSRIPGMFVCEAKMLIVSYYGHPLKAAWSLIAEWLRERRSHYRWAVLLTISDAVGWTKLYDVPETQDFRRHQQRHGRKCSGSPNCDDMGCIERSIPKWFRWLTRWDWE